MGTEKKVPVEPSRHARAPVLSRESSILTVRERVVSRMRKRDITLGVCVGLLAALFNQPQVQETLGPSLSNFSAAAQTALNGLGLDLHAVLEMPGVAFNFSVFPFASYDVPLQRPGLIVAAEGLTAHYPIFIIPGFTTTGLEVWEGAPCAKKYFRQRMWGTITMMRAFMLDKECWATHMRLDPATGGDPPGVKLRAAQGLEAVDYVMPGYNVWGRMIESLADIGYDNNNLYSVPYDWRLSLTQLERRDGYFTRLKSMLELSLKVHDRKAAVLSHSYGDTLFRYFMTWVESPRGGGGGHGWVERHVAEYVSIAASQLGAPKVLSGLLSGEMLNTAEMQGLQEYLANTVVPYELRLGLWRTWGSLLSILPVGGESIWGNLTYTPDVEGEAVPFLSDMGELAKAGIAAGNLTVEGALDLLWQLGGKRFAAAGATLSYGADLEGRLLQDHDLEPKHWANPLEARLPNAPSLRIYSIYGVGIPTERAYFYTPAEDAAPAAAAAAPAADAAAGDSPADHAAAKAAPRPWAEDQPQILIDSKVTRATAAISVRSGVYIAEGDATVPLISLGYMCAKGWQYKRFNPSGVKCTSREYPHEGVSILSSGSFQGGPGTADHVDIMGNHRVALDVLRVVAGRGAELEEQIHSNIREIAARVDLARQYS